MDIKELAQAILDDETLQVNLGADDWIDATARNAMSTWLPTASLVRLAPPPPTPVDLSVLIESGIDCEFGARDGMFGPLVKIDHFLNDDNPVNPRPYSPSKHVPSSTCRPRMNHWHAWNGGDCPLPVGVEVRTSYRDRAQNSDFTHEATAAIWKHDGQRGDIIAFRIEGLAEGYCWPWDVES